MMSTIRKLSLLKVYDCNLFQSLYSGLKSMLDHEDDDMQDTFMQTFRICYEDAFGSVLHHDLKENGDQIYVNQINKKVSELYSYSLIVETLICHVGKIRHSPICAI